MSSISSIGGSAFGAHVSRTKRGEGPEEGLKRDLTDFLTAQGVSTDDQKIILSEIKTAIDSAIGSGSRPDPSQIQASVSKVLEQHGVSGSDFRSQFPPPAHHGPRPSGPPPSTSSSTSSTDKTQDEQDSIQQLLEVLTEQAERNRIRTHQADPKSDAAKATNATTSAAAATSGSAAIANNIKATYSSTSVSSEIGALLSINA